MSRALGGVCELVVETAHLSGEFAYPVLSDPSVIDDWRTGDYGWDPGGEWTTDTDAYTTMAYPTSGSFGAGRYVQAPPGIYFMNDRGRWQIDSYGESFFARADFYDNLLFYNSPGNARQNHWFNLYAGIYSPSESGWTAVGAWTAHTLSGDDFSAIPDTNNTTAPDYRTGTEVYFQLHSVADLGRNYWTEAFLRGAVLHLEDHNSPVVTSVEPGPETADWLNDGQTTMTVSAHDPGLGLKWFDVYGPNLHEGEDLGCTGQHQSRCEWNDSRKFSFNVDTLTDGVLVLGVHATDILGRKSEQETWQVKIDNEAPEIDLAGTLYRHRVGGPETDETLHNEQYTLRLAATDGVANPSSGLDRRSGVASAQLEIRQSGDTWVELDSWTNPASGDNTPLEEVAFDFRPDAYAEGDRDLRVTVTDRAGNKATETFTVDIQRVPRAGTQPYFSFADEALSDRSRLSVNTANGNLLVRSTDFQLAGIGLDLVLGRSYNSWQHDQAMDFGPGWSLSLGEHVRLENFAGTDVDLRLPDGAIVRFDNKDSSSGEYDHPPGVHATLTDTGADYVLDWYRRGVEWQFSTSGRLQQITDQNENRLELAYDANGRITRVINGLGPSTDRRRRVLDITARNTDGYIEAIHDPQLDRTWSYAYQGGRLRTATDPTGAVSTYDYDSQGRLRRITDDRGAATDIAYEAGVPRFARVTSVTRAPDADGTRPVTRFKWDVAHDPDNPCQLESPPEAENRVLGPRHTSSYTVRTLYVTDKTDRIKDVTDPDCGDASRTYDPSGNIDSIAGGVDTTFTYNSPGNENLTEIAQGNVTTQLGYGGSTGAPPHYPTSATDPQGNQRNYGYDTAFNRDQTTALDGGGQVAAQAHYDRNGVGTIDFVELATEADGPDADGDPDQVSRTDYQYTAEHELQTVIPPGRSAGDPTGLVEFTWDAASRLRSRTDGEGRTQTYDYDEMDRLTRVTYDSGAFVSFSYDPNGNRTAVTDIRGTTTWSYDLLNRPLQEQHGGTTVHAYSWDLAGNLLTHTQGGQTTSYGYDKRNFSASVTDPDGKLIELNYGTQGTEDRRLTSIRVEPTAGQQGKVDIDYDYDGSGRIKKVAATLADGTVLEDYRYGYVDDQSTNPPAASGGLREFVEDHALDRCTDYTYDWLNRLIEARMTDDAQDCDFDRDGSANQLHRWQYEYDAASNLIESTHNGNTTTYRVNSRHELCWTAPGTPTGDCANPPTDADDYDYNQAGDLLDAADRYQLSYNERGQTATITPDGAPAAGQLYAETGQSQRIASGSASFLYSLLGLQTADQPTPGSGDPLAQGQTRYVRAPDGSLLSQRNPDGSTEYFLYDAHPGSVVALVNPDRIDTGQNPITARYRYDPYGNVIDKTGSSDTPWRYAGAYFDRFPNADPNTQAGLYKMGERYYDPRTARWTQKDPLDQSADLREGNGHMYAGADPVNRADAGGLDIQFSAAFYYVPGGSFSVTLEDEGFPVHISVGAGVGAGGGASLQFGEFSPSPHVGVSAQACGGIWCGNAFAGLEGTGYGSEWTAGHEEHFGIGLGGGAGVEVGY